MNEQMKREALEACPFCGGEAKYLNDPMPSQPVFITCLKCGAQTAPSTYTEVRKLWNTRHDYQSGLNAGLERALERGREWFDSEFNGPQAAECFERFKQALKSSP